MMCTDYSKKSVRGNFKSDAVKINIQRTPAKDTLKAVIVTLIVVLISGCLDKAIFGTGMTLPAGKIITFTLPEIIYSRASTFIILALTLFLSAHSGISKSTLKSLLILWLPLVIYLWAELPVLEGNISVALRTLNFFAVIITASLLASNQILALNLCNSLYYIIAITNFLGLLLFTVDNTFSYFSDGFGIMFTGIYPQKDLLSTTAALSAIFAIFRIYTDKNLMDILILFLQITVLIMASTISSISAFLIAVIAVGLPRFMLGLSGFFALALPIAHPVFGAFATLLGKDPTFTGRTLLWDFTINHAMETPILGHGFKHISSSPGWVELLQSEFTTDSFFIPHAHNLWVEGFDKFGLIGVIILTITLVINPTLRMKPYKKFNLYHLCLVSSSFWLVKSSLTMPFLNSDASSYLWAFALSYIATSKTIINPEATHDHI